MKCYEQVSLVPNPKISHKLILALHLVCLVLIWFILPHLPYFNPIPNPPLSSPQKKKVYTILTPSSTSSLDLLFPIIILCTHRFEYTHACVLCTISTQHFLFFLLPINYLQNNWKDSTKKKHTLRHCQQQ